MGEKTNRRIVIAGGTGFIGSALAREFVRRDYEVIVLTRRSRQRRDGVREVVWDGEHAGDWMRFFDGTAAVINLTGKNINCPHTPENLRDIKSSRVNSVNAVAAAVLQAKSPPSVWVQASAMGYYGDIAAAIVDESAPNGDDALSKICRDWENSFTSVELPATRKVTLRTGLVLGIEGGALPVLARLTKLFLGGAVGSGRQYMSWIHLADLVRMFVAAVENENLSGPFNAVAPNPVTNAEFMRALRRVLDRPWSPPVPAFAVKLGARLMGSEPSLALVGQRCAPKKLVAAGFQFQFPELAPALMDLFQKI